MRVLIADDAILLREAVAQLLQGAGFDVVAQAGDAGELLRKARAHRPDVAIVDIRMPPGGGDDGLQAARRIRAELPEVGVLLLSHYVEAVYATQLLEEGAAGAGYLLKDRIADIDRFTDAVRVVGEGGSVLDDEVVEHLLGRRGAERAFHGLERAEREVLAHMAAGASNVAIARRMHLSERTVQRHVTAIFRRLGLAASRHGHRRVLAVLAYLQAT
jgi:DNA-binding NarL/FixJ family response regulator